MICPRCGGSHAGSMDCRQYSDLVKPVWDFCEGLPVSEMVGGVRLADGNTMTRLGDIHNTIDINPESKTFGEVHWTLRLKGGKEYHGPEEG